MFGIEPIDPYGIAVCTVRFLKETRCVLGLILNREVQNTLLYAPLETCPLSMVGRHPGIRKYHVAHAVHC